MKRRIDKEDIIDAGMDLMFLNGYSATGIKEITDKIDIPKGSFYNHFKSKEDFGLAVLNKYATNGLKYHERALLSGDVSPLNRLKQFYAAMIENYGQVVECKLGCIMGNFSQELADVNENFRISLDKEFNAQENVIVQCIQQAKEANEINKDINEKLTGAFMINSWHGAFIRMKTTATTKPLEDFNTVVFETLLV